MPTYTAMHMVFYKFPVFRKHAVNTPILMVCKPSYIRYIVLSTVRAVVKKYPSSIHVACFVIRNIPCSCVQTSSAPAKYADPSGRRQATTRQRTRKAVAQLFCNLRFISIPTYIFILFYIIFSILSRRKCLYSQLFSVL